jgi:hypothetical protein
LEAREVHGLACAPVSRAVADALREWTEGGVLEAGLLGPQALRTVLREAVADGGPDGVRACPPAELLDELREAGLLDEPRIRAAVDELLAAERQSALGGVRELAAAELLPAPLAGPELRMRGGTFVAVPDLYWPEEGVAVEVDTALRCLTDGEAAWVRAGQHRMSYLGVRVLHLTAVQVLDEPDAVADQLRQALRTGGTDRVDLQITEG